jgi:hypothetical protein
MRQLLDSIPDDRKEIVIERFSEHLTQTCRIAGHYHDDSPILFVLGMYRRLEGSLCSIREKDVFFYSCIPIIHSLEKIRQFTGSADIYTMIDRLLQQIQEKSPEAGELV